MLTFLMLLPPSIHKFLEHLPIVFCMLIGIFSIQIVIGLLGTLSGAEKSPSPNGFSILFFQIFWDTVKSDILSLFGQFYNGNTDLRCLNYALVALIPRKKEGVSMINEFCLLASSMPSSRSSLKFLPSHCVLTSTSLLIKFSRSSQRIDIFLIVLLMHMKYLQLRITLILRWYFLSLILKGLLILLVGTSCMSYSWREGLDNVGLIGLKFAYFLGHHLSL